MSVWTSTVRNKRRWEDVLSNQFVIVAQDKGKAAGFGTLDKGNYIDMFFIDKDFQRQGIARQIYIRLENEAKRLGTNEITSNVSKTARMFFEKMGFKVLKEQTVTLEGIDLNNYKMTKKLDEPLSF
ncbi:GNAT family N-acetyltransferase [Desertivirga arenae]|uniref:GNAT family N-acetyltransferase n=1 Tax=Desertivirga arenae TaxID=2810309 RepID=UPI001A962043